MKHWAGSSFTEQTPKGTYHPHSRHLAMGRMRPAGHQFVIPDSEDYNPKCVFLVFRYLNILSCAGHSDASLPCQGLHTYQHTRKNLQH
jgi:hypothetical protein